MLTTLKCMTPTDGLIFRAYLYQSGLGLFPPFFWLVIETLQHASYLHLAFIHYKYLDDLHEDTLVLFLRSYTFMLFFSFNTDLSTYGNLDEQICFLSAEVLTCHPVSYLRKNNETWANIWGTMANSVIFQHSHWRKNSPGKLRPVD